MSAAHRDAPRSMGADARADALARGLALGAVLGGALTLLATSAAARDALRRWNRDGGRREDDAERRTKDALIARLGLVPHPEGGFFVETYRAGRAPMSSRGKTAFDDDARRRDDDAAATTRRTDDEDDGTRNQMTSIYYMLTRDSDHQWWAMNASDHVHYHHAGGAVTYHLVSADGTYARRTLGSDVENGETPQLVVAGGTYKAAVLAPGAEFALIGEGVSPGFDFRDFEFVSASALMSRNAACFDDANHLVKPSPEDTFDHYYATDGASTPTTSEDYFTPTRDDATEA